MGLHDPLADGQAQAGVPAGSRRRLRGTRPGELVKQPGQALRRYAPAPVGHGEGHVHPVPCRADPDGGVGRRVAGGVGQQVAQHLGHPPPVGQHQGQVGRHVNLQGVPAPAAAEGVPGPVHQHHRLGGFGQHRQGARLDAGHVQQVGHQVVHVVGLVLDDAEELAHHARVRLGGGAQHRGGGALDGRQGRPQLVADHAQELGPQPLLFLHRRQVLHGHHEGLHRPVPGQDGGGVEQDGDAAPVGDPQHDLLGPHRLPGAEGLGQGEIL